MDKIYDFISLLFLVSILITDMFYISKHNDIPQIKKKSFRFLVGLRAVNKLSPNESNIDSILFIYF